MWSGSAKDWNGENIRLSEVQNVKSIYFIESLSGTTPSASYNLLLCNLTRTI